MTASTTSPAASAFGPTVAGRFYPANPDTLRDAIRTYLTDGTHPEQTIAPNRRVVALIAPHAGYVYSGPVAGFAYAAVKDTGIKTVAVLSPSHHARRDAACTLNADVYRTPIGDVPIAKDLVSTLLVESHGAIVVDDTVFAPEHALDVHIPFIHEALPNARLIPIIVPSLSMERLDALAGLLFDTLGSDPHALVVASSDLSHFYDYDKARLIDRQIADEIERHDLEALHAHHQERRGPCGAAPITVATDYLARFGDQGRITRLKLLNSGDTRPEGRDRVVGYLSAAMTVPK